jgi:hypothetical protein
METILCIVLLLLQLKRNECEEREEAIMIWTQIQKQTGFNFTVGGWSKTSLLWEFSKIIPHRKEKRKSEYLWLN